LVSSEEINRLLRRALARSRSLVEICGLLVDNGTFLSLVETRNVSRRYGSFQLHRGDWGKVERAAHALGWEVVGTFHSHIASDPIPSRGDIEGAMDGHLMLILDATGRTFDLWQIRRGKAHKRTYEVHPES
jgi:proteasome lid subunit RPN8/RPN11